MNLFNITTSLLILFLSQSVLAFEYSSWGIDIKGNTVSVQNDQWSAKKRGLIEQYDTLAKTLGGQKTIFVNKLDQSTIQSIIVKQLDKSNPKDPGRYVTIVSSDGLVSCAKGSKMYELSNECFSVTLDQCNRLEESFSKMTGKEIEKCASLVKNSIAYDQESSQIQQLRLTLNNQVPEIKDLPTRKPSESFYKTIERCKEYSSFNPGLAAEIKAAPNQNFGHKSAFK